jgi:hypothetical protein
MPVVSLRDATIFRCSQDEKRKSSPFHEKFGHIKSRLFHLREKERPHNSEEGGKMCNQLSDPVILTSPTVSDTQLLTASEECDIIGMYSSASSPSHLSDRIVDCIWKNKRDFPSGKMPSFEALLREGRTVRLTLSQC